MNRRRTFSLASLGLVTAMCLTTACSSDQQSTAGTGAGSTPASTTAPAGAVTTEAATTTAGTAVDGPITTATTPPETDDTDATSATDTPTTDTASTVPATETPTTVADIVQRVPGLATVELTAAGDDPQRPIFSWTPPAGATSYQLVVQAADGTPIWAWTGAATTIGLGGDALPAGAEGPTLSGPARARVYALAGGTSVVAVSPWLDLPGA